jgi:hypothetical protein
MDTILGALVLLLVAGVILFVIYAWAKGWLRGAGARGSFTSRVIMHDMLEKSKQRAMEYHMDEEEEREKREASWGEDKKPGQREGDEKRS